MSRLRHARVRLRPPWLLAGVLLVLFSVLLVIAGFAEAEVGVDGDTHEPGPSGQVPAGVQDGGPIIHGNTDPVGSTDLPPKTMALTFDDGPDPPGPARSCRSSPSTTCPPRSSWSAPAPHATRS